MSVTEPNGVTGLTVEPQGISAFKLGGDNAQALELMMVEIASVLIAKPKLLFVDFIVMFFAFIYVCFGMVSIDVMISISFIVSNL